MKWCGAVCPEISDETAAATNCFWPNICVIRNFDVCVADITTTHRGGKLKATITGTGHYACDASCKSVAVADMVTTIATLNTNAADIDGAYLWKTGADGMPEPDFANRANDKEVSSPSAGEEPETPGEVHYPLASQKLLAFPTAEGFGKFASGGRGGKAVNESNLKFVRATVSSQLAEWHLGGNHMDGSDAVTADNSLGFATDGNAALAPLSKDFLVPEVFFPIYHFDINAYTLKDKMQSAEEAYNDVLEKVGCINRDAIEKRIVEECRTGSASHNGDWKDGYADSGIIDDPADLADEMAYDANGFLYCKAAAPSETRAIEFDSDNDGIADEWERAHGLTVGVQDNNAVNSDGYTALEVYANSIMGEDMDTSFSTTGINSCPAAPVKAADACYNLSGRRVGDNYKGIVVKSGKKVVLENNTHHLFGLIKKKNRGATAWHLCFQ